MYKAFGAPALSTGNAQMVMTSSGIAVTPGGSTNGMTPPSEAPPVSALISPGNRGIVGWRVGDLIKASAIPLVFYNELEWTLNYKNVDGVLAEGSERKLLSGLSTTQSLEFRPVRIKNVFTLTGVNQSCILTPPPGSQAATMYFLKVTQSIAIAPSPAIELDFRLTGQYQDGTLMSDMLPNGYLGLGMQQKNFGAFSFYVVMVANQSGLVPAGVRVGAPVPFEMEVQSGTAGGILTLELVDDRNDANIAQLLRGVDAAATDGVLSVYSEAARASLR